MQCLKQNINIQNKVMKLLIFVLDFLINRFDDYNADFIKNKGY